MTYLNLDRLREVSGVFITESDFQVIELQYLDALKIHNLTDTEEIAEQFYEEWIAEQEMLGTFTETADGAVKYYCPEGANEVKLSTMELMAEKDMSS